MAGADLVAPSDLDALTHGAVACGGRLRTKAPAPGRTGRGRRYDREVRRGRWLVLAVALAGAGAVVAISDKPLTTLRGFAPSVELDEAEVRHELREVERALASRGYERTLQRAVSSDVPHVRVSSEVPPGGCVAVVAATWGRLRVGALEWVPQARSVSPRETSSASRAEPYRRWLVRHVCPMRYDADYGATVTLDATIARAGAGGGQVLVMRGEPTMSVEDGPPIGGDKRVEIRTTWWPAILNALVALFALLVIGVTVESTVHTRIEQRDRERTLRWFTLALPAGLRGQLAPLASGAASGSAADARALRDALVDAAPLVRMAVFARWRDDRDAIDPRHEALRSTLRARRAEARQAGYRAGDDGLALLTLLVRHRCELPELRRTSTPRTSRSRSRARSRATTRS